MDSDFDVTHIDDGLRAYCCNLLILLLLLLLLLQLVLVDFDEDEVFGVEHHVTDDHLLIQPNDADD